MKRCNAYEFREFRVTMIDNASLPERLARELRFLGHQVTQAWPDFKHDPIGFGKHLVMAGELRLRRALVTPHSLAAFATAMLVVLSAVLFLVLIDNRSINDKARIDGEKELAELVEFLPNPEVFPEGLGVGAGSNGRVGIAKGRGEGSGPVPKKSTGGGGGGDHNPLPAQVGKPPQPSAIPAPIPQFPPVNKQALPVAGIDIDPALWKNLSLAVYGDPRSKSSAPSNGPGDGGGMGTANGTGIGEGRYPSAHGCSRSPNHSTQKKRAGTS